MATDALVLRELKGRVVKGAGEDVAALERERDKAEQANSIVFQNKVPAAGELEMPQGRVLEGPSASAWGTSLCTSRRGGGCGYRFGGWKRIAVCVGKWEDEGESVLKVIVVGKHNFSVARRLRQLIQAA